MNKSLLIHPDELSSQWIDRLCALGVDTLGIHHAGGRYTAQTAEELVNIAATDEFRALIDCARSRGLKVEYALHAAGYLLARELFGEHPEYFRMNEQGERVDDFNLCVSCDDALELASDRAVELANSLYGSSDRLYFWLDDGADIQCRCEKCRELSPSDQQMIFLNRTIEKLRRSNPDARLAYLAYYDTEALPTIRPREGIFLEYAPFLKEIGKPASDMDGAALERLDRLLEFFGNEGSRVLEYWYDNSRFSGWRKPPKPMNVDAELVRRDLEFYRSKGFEEAASFACFLGDDYVSLHGEPDLSGFEG